MDKISVIVPCYNEEEALPLFYKEINKAIKKMSNVSFELIFVDDGSSDRTLNVIKGFSKDDDNVRYISFSRNFGKEAAIYAGLEYSTGDYVTLLDADLQEPPELIEKMYKLADECLQITLAVSLHAPNDEIRNKIMPVSKKNDMDRLLEACKYYSDTTKRRITFEYAMISGVNDSLDCAKELSERLRNMLCHINLIPVNDVKERNYKKSSGETVERFAEFLNSKGIETTVRRKLGSDINAACGQLRKGYLEKRQ